MSAFMILAVVILVVVVFVFSVVSIARKATLKKQTDKVIDSLFDKTALQQYIESCLYQTAKDATQDIFSSGGFYWNVTKPGTDIKINENMSFLPYYDDVTDTVLNVSYLLFRGYDDYAPFYPCPLFGDDCGGPGERRGEATGTNLYCKYSFTDFPYLDTCTYGDLASLYLELTPNSVEKQLEALITNRISTCVDLTALGDKLGYEVDEIHEGDIKTDVAFSSKSIKYKLDFPVVVELSDVQSIRVSSAKYELSTDIKTLFDRAFFGANSVLRQEISTLNATLEGFITDRLALNSLEYDIEVHHNVFALDDIYLLSSKTFELNGEPFRFLFAVGNRMPVLDLIDLAPDNDTCEILVPPGVGITIEPLAKDPDEEDELFFSFDAPDGWTRNGDTLFKELQPDDDDTVVNVIVSDGLLNDSQQVKVCVDGDVEIDVLPEVDFYYDYEMISEQYFDVADDALYQRITLEDPITLSLPSGITMEGYFTLGDCRIDMPVGGSNCVVFPSDGASCNEPYTISVANIKDGLSGINDFDDCHLVPGSNEKVTFYDRVGNEQGFTKVHVDECVPHKDISSKASESEYLATHECCNADYTYAGSSGITSTSSKLFCGKAPDDSFTDSTANDIFQKTISRSCLADRGNFIDLTIPSVEVWDNSGNPVQECPEGDDYGVDARCMGCGTYGTFAESMACMRFDYDKRDEYKASFESYFYKTETPAICNDEIICAQRSGPGEYKPENNESSLNVLACTAGCNGNNGRCDYAVECTCSIICGGSEGSTINYVDLACDGKEPGEPSGTCSNGNPAIEDVCTNTCQIGDATNGVFRCDGTSDCNACDSLCDGSKPYKEINSCSGGENALLQDYCDGSGHVQDYVTPLFPHGKCFYDESLGCDLGDPECSGVGIGEILPELTSTEDPLRTFMCDSSCKLVVSQMCSNDRDVVTDCRGQTLGVAFDTGGRTNPDAICTACDASPQYCNAYAWNDVEGRCYTSEDDEVAEVKCNYYSDELVDGNVICK